jgi:hypothetical protein
MTNYNQKVLENVKVINFAATPNINTKKITNNTTNGDLVKTSDFSSYIENYVLTQPNYSEDEKLVFAALTGTEIFLTSNNSNYYTSNAIENNVLKTIEVKNSILPKDIIKLQKADAGYFSSFLAQYSYSVNSSTGLATVTIPKNGNIPSYQIQVQTITPKVIKNDTIY